MLHYFLKCKKKKIFTFKKAPSCSFKYIESSDVVVIKKKNLLKVY